MSGQDLSAKTKLETDTINKDFKKPVYTTTRLLGSRPEIDGKLNDECWKEGEWAGHYHQYIPNEGAEPSHPTEFKILYDDRFIFIAIRAYDSEPEKIQRYAGPRDEFTGDMVGVNFDSYHDYRTGFEFDLTAWGQKLDLVLFNPENWDFNWSAVWKGKTGLEDSAWIAEFEIPLSQLRYSKEEDQVWGLHVWRWENRYQEESDWEPLSKTGPGVIYQFGELKGIKDLKKSQRLEIMPYTLGELRTFKKEEGNPFTDNGRTWGGNVGLDAKIGISSNFTVDLTVNPDFGQVESDPSVMNLTAFETFYEEKRPFFLEGLTIFDYEFDDVSLFYSRRIGHSPSLDINPSGNQFFKTPDKTSILSAVKLSGTTSKGFSAGLIQSVTANEFARISDNDGKRSSVKVEPLTSYTVARVQQGINEGNTVVGGMLTSTNRAINDNSLDFLSTNAFTGGLDLLHHWKDKEFFVDARLVGSYLEGNTMAITALQESSAHYFQRPGLNNNRYDTTKTGMGGYGGKLKIGKGSKGFWRYSAGINWLSPGLELNDLGYMTTADNVENENEVSFFVNKPVSIFRTYKISLEQFNKWTYDKTFLGSGGHLSWYSEFRNKWNISANFIYQSQGYDTKILRGGYDMKLPFYIMSFGSIYSDNSKKIYGGVAYNFQHYGNDALTTCQITPSLSIRPLNILKIQLSADYTDNHDQLQYVATTNYLSEKRYILGTIDQKTLGITLRVNLNITPEFSIQYYGNPYISRGTYSEFKRVTDPEADNYNNRISVYENLEPVSGIYSIYENDDQITDYSFSDPDFNFHQFRSNLVAKWEYRLGSFIYLVWSREQTGTTGLSEASFIDSYRQMKNAFPNNIFLIKANYWFSL